MLLRAPNKFFVDLRILKIPKTTYYYYPWASITAGRLVEEGNLGTIWTHEPIDSRIYSGVGNSNYL